jgi:hypothetical protein
MPRFQKDVIDKAKTAKEKSTSNIKVIIEWGETTFKNCVTTGRPKIPIYSNILDNPRII